MNGIGNSIGRSLELKDIVLTSAPSGNEWIWWAAAAAAIVLVAVQLLRAVPFSHARRELRRIRKSSSFPSDMNFWLKKYAMIFFGREACAGLQGAAWLEFLDMKGGTDFSDSRKIWDEMLYGGRIMTDLEKRELYRECRRWLRRIRRRKLWYI